tara:strand:+ start:562 stop:876 length:315 start_codon:yes stop_codon:yes gene_type:complete
MRRFLFGALMKNRILLLNKYTSNYKIGDLFIMDGTEHVLELDTNGGFVDCHFGPVLERGMIALLIETEDWEDAGGELLFCVNGKIMSMPYKNTKPKLALLMDNY